MRRMIPSLQSLICFESAAKHQSYTHAAQELHLTQSAVSRQIQQLEVFLDLSLFNRTRYGVELTHAGEQYYKNIKSHLLGIEQHTLDIMSHKGLGGTLKLGVVPTFATCWLLPKLHHFNAMHPEITIHIETSTKPFLFNEAIFDAAIYAGTQQQVEHWPGVDTHYLMDEDLIAVCSPKLIAKHFPQMTVDNVDLLELSTEQLLQLPLLQQTTRPEIWTEWFKTNHIFHPKPHEGHRHELFSMLAVASKQAIGMALIPQILIESELRNKELVIVSRNKLLGSRAYYLVHENHDSSPLIKKFIDWIQNELIKHPSYSLDQNMSAKF